MQMPRTRVILLALLVLSAPIIAGCLESFKGNQAPAASFTVTESGTLKADMLIHFNALGSDPDGDTMTYAWDFGDNNIGQGAATTHTYSSSGDYTVVLSVSDGEFETTAEQTFTIFSADAQEPTAALATSKMNNCDDDDPPASGTYILVWLCDDMEDSELEYNPSTTVTLDASGSQAGGSEAWLVDWKWDLNMNVDSDGDGNKANDVDAEGETFQWAVPAGEWRVQVTVYDDQGMSASEDSWVYVNARATWTTIEIGRNNSADNPRVEFTFPLTYDLDDSHKINRVKSRLVYPEKDPGAGCGAPCELSNRMDLYTYNESDEDVRDTTQTVDESRSDSDCSDDDRCVSMTSSTGDFRDFCSGGPTPSGTCLSETWKITVANNEQHNAEIGELRIELVYK